MTAYFHLHQKPKAASFTQLPNFLFETPTYQPLSNEAKMLYAFTIDYLTQENEGLKEKAKDESSIKKQLEAAKLKQENEQLRQFISKIPPDVRREIQQRHSPQKGRVDRV